MFFLLISFIAGILTVLAPCILPLLPVIIGGTVSNGRKSKPYIIVVSLSVSVIVFTLLLKFSTALINIPQSFWQWVSGLIIVFFGLTMLFPEVWEKLTLKFNYKFSRKGNELLAQGVKQGSIKGDILIGSALGPVFTSCSPTYFVILATVLPESFTKGLIYLLAYTIGLSLMLLLISLLGQKLTMRLQNFSDPEGKFKKTLGVIFILVGVFIISGFDKKIQTWVVENDIFDVTNIEQKLLENVSD